MNQLISLKYSEKLPPLVLLVTVIVDFEMERVLTRDHHWP